MARNSLGSPSAAGDPSDGGSSGAVYGSSLGAKVKVDSSDLREMLSLWQQNTKALKAFNAELSKSQTTGGTRGVPLGVGATGTGRMKGMSDTPSGFSGHINQGTGNAPPPSGGQTQRNNGGGNSGQSWGTAAAVTTVAAISKMGSSLSNNLPDILAASQMYRNMSLGSGGAMSGTQARQFVFGGGPQKGIGGFGSSAELQQGYSTLGAVNGPGFAGTPRGQGALAAAGRIGNLTGSFQQGASAMANLQAPQTYFRAQMIGINTMDYKNNPEKFATDVLKKVNGGTMPTTQQIEGGMHPGGRLWFSLQNLGLNDDMMQTVAMYGEALNKGGPGISLAEGKNHQVVDNAANRRAGIGTNQFSKAQAAGNAKTSITQTLGAKSPLAGYFTGVATAGTALIGALQGFVGTIAGYGATGGMAGNAIGGVLGIGGRGGLMGTLLGGGGPGGILGGAGGGGGGGLGLLALLGAGRGLRAAGGLLGGLFGRGAGGTLGGFPPPTGPAAEGIPAPVGGAGAAGGISRSLMSRLGLGAVGAIAGQAITHQGMHNGHANPVARAVGDTVTGAAIGTAIMPGLGTLVGGGVGLVAGLVNSHGPNDAIKSSLTKAYTKDPQKFAALLSGNPGLKSYAEKNHIGPYADSGGTSNSSSMAVAMSSASAMRGSSAKSRGGKGGPKQSLKVVRPVAAAAGQKFGNNGHPGTDYPCACGTNILAAEDGIVLLAGPAQGFGNWIVIQHPDGYYTVYGHMYDNGVLVHSGQQVKAGTIIGKVGSNGNSSGCHLHLEVHNGWPGVRLDPEAWLTGHGAASVSGTAASSSTDSSTKGANAKPHASMATAVNGLAGNYGSREEVDVLSGALSSMLSSGVTSGSASENDGTANSSSSSGTTGSTGDASSLAKGAQVPTSTSGNTKLAQQMAASRGWTGNEWQALYKLWTQESGFNEKAKNPSSGAYGIPQSLPANKMASAGSDYLTNPSTQIKWGLDYIAGRYKDPLGAWSHETQYNWYREGTYSAKAGLAQLHGGEMVINQGQANQIRAYIRSAQTSQGGSSGSGTMKISSGGGTPVIVHLTAPVTLAGGPQDARVLVDNVVSAMQQDERLKNLVTDMAGVSS